LLISIPSGAIKRELKTLDDKRAMVISIPSGAIKRKLEDELTEYDINFNSFWCD